MKGSVRLGRMKVLALAVVTAAASWLAVGCGSAATADTSSATANPPIAGSSVGAQPGASSYSQPPATPQVSSAAPQSPAGSSGNPGGGSNLIPGTSTDPGLSGRCWIDGTNEFGGPKFSVLLHNPSGQIADVFNVTVQFDQRAPYTEYSPEMLVDGSWVSGPAILAIEPGKTGQLKGSDLTIDEGSFTAKKCRVVNYN